VLFENEAEVEDRELRLADALEEAVEQTELVV
jgi:hypothetical protein